MLASFVRLWQVQLIVELAIDAEEYASRSFQRSIVAPAACPHCRVRASLETLGYYHRNVTGKKSTILRLSIRRFRCKMCGKTVSLLPAFAQPYRLLHNRTIHRFFCGDKEEEDVKPWLALLRRYWKRFSWWVTRDGAVPRSRFDHSPQPRSPAAWWAAVVALFGSLIVATKSLVTDFQVTLFGRYRCHRPNVLFK